MTETTSRSLHFSINGDFINKTAREMVFLENPPRITEAIKLVMSCIQTDQMSEGDRLLLAIRIIEGDADIVGVYPGDSYGVETHEPAEHSGKLAERINDLIQQVSDLKDELHTRQDMFNLATEDLTEYKKRMINRVWRTDMGGKEDIFPDVVPESRMSSAASALLKGMLGPDAPADPVQDFLDRMRSDTTDDYGWLAPNGTFYPAEWGKHNEWAADYVEAHPEQFGITGTPEEIENKVSDLRVAIRTTDVMVDHGWALLHNPSQGTALVTSSPRKNLTKAQREFLYDYYTKRNKPDRANQYIKEGD